MNSPSGPLRVRRVLTTRAGGRSSGPWARFNLSHGVGDDPVAVAANRTRAATTLGVPLVFLRQVHGIRVHTVAAGPDGAPPALPPTEIPDVDAVVTTATGLGLAVLSADCVPVLLADSDAGVIGAAHAGRVGAAGGVVAATVATMVELGAAPERTDVLLGPAVCGPCYEVPAAMRDEVEAHLPGSATRTGRGTPALDLRAGLARQLAGLGVTRVGVDPRCTVEDPELYSHRRDRRTGRQAAIIWRERPDRPPAS